MPHRLNDRRKCPARERIRELLLAAAAIRDIARRGTYGVTRFPWSDPQKAKFCARNKIT